MKKGLTSVLLLVTMSLNLAMGTTTSVPVKVQEAFNKMYPNASATEWRLDDDVYVANFKAEEITKEAVFEKSGKWTETRSTFTADVLSETAKKGIAQKFPQSKLEEVIMIERPNSKRLEVWVNTKEDELVTVVLNDKDKIIDSY